MNVGAGDPFGQLRFDGQGALVVGGASGLGAAAAELLALRGADVTVLDRKRVEADRRHVTVDVTDDDALATALHAAEAGCPHPLSVVVNCVGITGINGTASHLVPLDDFDLVVRVNLRAAFALSRLVLPGMVERRYGRILHVASIAGKDGNAFMASYSATKAGLIGLVKSLGKEYAGTGVTVNSLAPAVIQTPLVDAMPPEQVARNLSKIPMGRPGALSEAAETIAFAVSRAAGYTTGFCFDLSGGRAVY